MILKVILFIALALALACSTSGTGLNFYSYDLEEEAGNQFANDISKNQKLLNDKKLDQYISSLGQKMISEGVDEPHFTYTFQVIDSDEVNAFAIPGGHVYVNLALIKEAETEAEMVGVIGHEIGHVIHRHGTKRMTDSAIVQGLAGVAQEAAGTGTEGRLVGAGVALFGQAGLLMYGRNAELEADQTGIDILSRTGYDERALPHFFEKLLKIEQQRGVTGGRLSELLATHPPTEVRIAHANDYISELKPQSNPIENSPEFAEIRRYVAPLKPAKTKLSQEG